MHFFGALFRTCFRFMPADVTYIFIELKSLNSLFSVEFLASILDQILHLLVKFSCQSACENLDATSARSTVCFFPGNIAVEQEIAATTL